MLEEPVDYFQSIKQLHTKEETHKMTNPFPHHFIAIEGNIGAGKTTLCHRLQKDFDCRLILEQFTDNPFLPFFYENQERYAFPVELFFMTERHKQLQEQTQRDLFQDLIVSDYFFLKTLLFAKNNLNAEEYRLFQRLFHILKTSFPKPDLIVFLHRSVDNLLEKIKLRGREYEQDITAEYLQGIQETYYDYFRTDNTTPILIIDVEQLDFQNEAADYEMIVEAMKKKYRPGVNYLSFV